MCTHTLYEHGWPQTHWHRQKDIAFTDTNITTGSVNSPTSFEVLLVRERPTVQVSGSWPHSPSSSSDIFVWLACLAGLKFVGISYVQRIMSTVMQEIVRNRVSWEGKTDSDGQLQGSVRQLCWPAAAIYTIDPWNSHLCFLMLVSPLHLDPSLSSPLILLLNILQCLTHCHNPPPGNLPR